MTVKFCLEAVSSDINHSIPIYRKEIHVFLADTSILHSQLPNQSAPSNIEAQPAQVLLKRITIVINLLSQIPGTNHSAQQFRYTLKLGKEQHGVRRIRLNTKSRAIEKELIIPLTVNLCAANFNTEVI